MKYLVVFFAVFLSLCSFGFSAHCEPNNPYPPPPQTTETMPGAINKADQHTPSGGEIIADLVLVRPVSLAAYGGGIAASVVATPFTLVSGTTRQTYRTLLDEPFNFAVCRPLGEATTAGY